MKSRLKRVISLILCSTMVLSLLPALPAAAAGPVDGDPVHATNYDNDAAFKAFADAQPDKAFVVTRYVAPGTDGNPSDAARLDFGIYKTALIDSFEVQMLYDNKDVSLMQYQGGTLQTNPFPVEAISDAGQQKSTLIPKNYPADGVTDNFEQHKVFANADAGVSTTFGKNIFEIIKVTIGDEATALTGNYQLLLMRPTSGVNTTAAKSLTKLTEADTTDAGKIKVQTNEVGNTYESVFYLGSTYFKEKSPGSIDDTTFCYRYSTTGPNGGIGIYNSTTPTTQTAYIGFPKAKEVTADVTFTVNKSSVNATALANADVSITRTSGGNGSTVNFPSSGTYKTNSAGKLTSGGTIVGTTGKLAMPAGTYSYTVTPPVSEAGLIAYTGTFEVTTGAPSDKIIYAAEKPAGTEAYTITLSDEESGGAATPIAGAAVTFDGVSVGTTNAQGQFNVTKAPGKYSFAVTKDGFAPISLTATNGVRLIAGGSYAIDNGAAVTSIPLSQKKTTVDITAKKDIAVMTGAIVTVNQAIGGKVTPLMASKLPISKAADPTSGIASFNLPNGEYSYTIEAPGFEKVGPVAMVVKGNPTSHYSVAIGPALAASGTVTDGIINGGTVSANGSEVTDTTDTGKVTIAGDKVTGDTSNPTPVAITDPYYSVEGTWDNADDPQTLTLKVSLNNINTSFGTFGLKFDPKLFNFTAASDFVPSVNIQAPSNYTFNTQPISNPTTESGYHSFMWQTPAGAEIKAASGATLIGTYTLKVNKTNYPSAADVKAAVNSNSIFVKPYNQTSAATAIKAASKNDADYKYQIEQFWRDCDTANSAPLGAKRLAKEKSTDGGFLQVMAATETDPMEGSDVRTQIIYPNFGNVGVSFKVIQGTALKPAGPLVGATITVLNGTTPVPGLTATTDVYGKAILGVPQNSGYTFKIEKVGFSNATGDMTVTNKDREITAYMESDKTNNVRLDDPSKAKADLLGNSFVPIGQAYNFNVAPKAGYVWATGHPVIADFKVFLAVGGGAETEQVGKLTYDKAKNCFVIDASVATGADNTDVVIKLQGMSGDTVIKPIDPSDPGAENKNTITATAGAKGKLQYVGIAGSTSVFTPASPSTYISKVIESLGGGKGDSAKYTFMPDAPSSRPSDLTLPYTGNVIDKFVVNGTEVALTDKQRIFGVKDYQLTNITSDQVIAVTFGEATIKPGKEDTEDDDTVTQPIVPKSDPVISLNVGEYGAATISGAKILGAIKENYSVAPGSFAVTLAGEPTLAKPDGTMQSYEIDKILVNGIVVDAATSDVTLTKAVHGVDGTWVKTSGLLTLTGLALGDVESIVATFKPTGGSSIQAFLQTVCTIGNGKIMPIGQSVYTIGDMPVLKITPDSNWKLSALGLVEPGTVSVDVMKNVIAGGYMVPALKAGITTVNSSFEEQTFAVDILVDFQMGSSLTGVVPYFGAKFEMTRTTGGTPTTIVADFTNTHPVAGTVDYKVALPAGTWTIKMTKANYLSYTIKDFVINADGTATDTWQEGTGDNKVLMLGKKNNTTTQKSVAPIIGDASWDGNYVAANDIAQVANGMVTGASDARKKRADVDESIWKTGLGNVAVDTDMAYAKLALGKTATVTTYAEFIR